MTKNKRLTQFVERLENRQLLSAAHSAVEMAMGPFQTITAHASHRPVAKAAKVAKRIDGATGGQVAPSMASTQFLTPDRVSAILAAAASQAAPGQAIAVTDRQGTVLGVYQAGGGNPAFSTGVEFLAIQAANTAAQFESTQNAFTTRTARFIILDHFPQPIANTPGGPLYGVEFSEFPGSDVLPSDIAAGSIGLDVGLSGDPGGMPLYINGVPVGGIGVAGAMHIQAPNADLRNVLANTLPNNLIATGIPNFVALGQSLGAYERAAVTSAFNGKEISDFDESVALAGSLGYYAPPPIRSTNITVAGLTLPYTHSGIAKGKPAQTLDQLTATGAGSLVTVPVVGKNSSAIIAGTPPQLNGVVDGSVGLYRIRSSAAAAAANVDVQGIPIGSAINPANPVNPATLNSATNIIASPITTQPEITPSEVQTVINNTIAEAIKIRAGIRKPNGVKARIHVVVTDTGGNVLGVFSQQDATNFSYDVAVQKARTAAFFSDNSHAYTSTAIGFASQGFFPIGINGGGPGPLYKLQDFLMDNPLNLVSQGPAAGSIVNRGPLPDGITVFPGGDPLYNSSGQLIGAVGVSGDGVVQDDLMCYKGTTGFFPPDAIRSDHLKPSDAANFLIGKVNQIAALPGVSLGNFNVTKADKLLVNDLTKAHLPYVKFPRNPETL